MKNKEKLIIDEKIRKFVDETEAKETEIKEIPQCLANEIARPMLEIPGITC